MVRCLCLLLALIWATAMPLPLSAQRKPLLAKVDHFYLVSDKSERLFRFFRDEFQLPVVWPFNNHGDFASGGLSLGNVVIEFVTQKAGDGAAAQTEFKGLAFEPAGDADAAITELNRRHIPHGEPDPYKYTQDGQERVGWITINLKGMSPANANVFICDYKQRGRVAESQSRASGELAGRGGGPLGVTSLKEIVLGVLSVKEASQQWDQLLDSPRRETTTVFDFGPGPRIRLVQAEAEGIQRIVVAVKSTMRAKQFLTKRRMLGRADRGQLWIEPATVGGLVIVLVED